MKKLIITLVFQIVVLMATNIIGLAQPIMLWENAFGNADLYNFGQSEPTRDGGIISRGYTITGIATRNPIIHKFDTNGNSQWEKTYGKDYEGEGYCIKQTNDGGYLLTGKVHVSEQIHSFWLLKLDANGDSTWSRTYVGSTTSNGTDIVVNPDGTCFITGQKQSIDGWNALLMVVKITVGGDTLWTKSYENMYSYSCNSLIKCPEGGYAGITTIDPDGETGLMSQIIRFDENGDTLWTKSPPSGCMLNSISMTSDGGFIIAGMEYINDWDLLLLKTNPKGDKEWSKTFNGNSWEHGSDAKQTKNGGYIIAGTKSVEGSGNGLDGWLIRTDGQGNRIWSETYGGTEENERVLQVFVTSDNGYYVSGNVHHLFWAARFDADTTTTALTGVTNTALSTYRLNQNYPNPFTTTTQIEFSVPSTSKVTVSVFNMSGKEIRCLVDKEESTGSYTISWNGEDRHGNKVPPGIYFYRIKASDFIESKKCFVMR